MRFFLSLKLFSFRKWSNEQGLSSDVERKCPWIHILAPLAIYLRKLHKIRDWSNLVYTLHKWSNEEGISGDVKRNVLLSMYTFAPGPYAYEQKSSKALHWSNLPLPWGCILWKKYLKTLHKIRPWYDFVETWHKWWNVERLSSDVLKVIPLHV